jgi:hypothetical protein
MIDGMGDPEEDRLIEEKWKHVFCYGAICRWYYLPNRKRKRR